MRIGIFGAGQAGRMIKQWLPGTVNPICFIDNNPQKINKIFEGLRIVSFEEALTFLLDEIIIAVLNRDAESAIYNQIAKSSFKGEVITLNQINHIQDLRLAELRLISREINKKMILGDVAEVGVYRGEFAAEINRTFSSRKLFLFDTFCGFAEEDVALERQLINKGGVCYSNKEKNKFSDTDQNVVFKKLTYPDQAVFVSGRFPQSVGKVKNQITKFAFVSLDLDLYFPTLEGLRFFYPRLNSGGVIMVHDYNSDQYPGVNLAVTQFEEKENLMLIPLADLHGSAIIIHP